MTNYVNEDRFLQWYRSVCRKPEKNTGKLLNDLYLAYCDTGATEYTVPSSDSLTGRDESYVFRCEDIGCCGASTVYMYF